MSAKNGARNTANGICRVVIFVCLLLGVMVAPDSDPPLLLRPTLHPDGLRPGIASFMAADAPTEARSSEQALAG